MKKIKLEEEKKSDQKIKRFIKLGIFIVVVVFVIEIWAVNRLSTYGQQIQELKTAQASIELENQVLGNSIAQQVALNYLEEKANEYGFSTERKIEYFQVNTVAAVF